MTHEKDRPAFDQLQTQAMRVANKRARDQAIESNERSERVVALQHLTEFALSWASKANPGASIPTLLDKAIIRAGWEPRKSGFERDIRRWLKSPGKNPHYKSVFQLGQGFGNIGVHWASGTMFLILSHFKKESLTILDFASQSNSEDQHILKMVEFCLRTWSGNIEKPSDYVQHLTTVAEHIRAFKPNEYELFMYLSKSRGKETSPKDLGLLSLATYLSSKPRFVVLTPVEN